MKSVQPQSACPQSLAARLRDVQVSRRTDLTCSRHVNTDGVAYVVQHPITFQSHRFSADDYHVMSWLDGKRTLGRVFEALVKQDVLASEQEEDFYTFIVQLNALGLLNLPTTDGQRLHDRFQKREQSRRNAGISRFLFFRIPLFRPDNFLDRTMGLFRPVFSRTAAVLWSICLVISLFVVFQRSAEITNPLNGMAVSGNLLLMWGLLLGLKVIHEFGHAYACKFFGGRVPEMGAYLMMGSPCAYMDASSSWGFPRRRDRILVAMGGMYFESYVAMASLAVWCLTGPSLIHSAAYMTMVLSTIVTVAFNINPLMKYDGYFALSDALGLPHLREDAQLEMKRFFKKLTFGIKQPRVASTRRGQCGYLAFGAATAVYRVFIVFAISMTLSMIIPGTGPLILFACGGGFLIRTVTDLTNYLRFSEELNGTRSRAIRMTAGLATAAVFAVLFVPVPGGQRAAAVVVPEVQHVVYASEPGFLESSSVRNGQTVSWGDPICQLRNPVVTAAVDHNRIRVDSAVAAVSDALAKADRYSNLEAAVTRQRMLQGSQDLQQSEFRANQLTVSAPADGVVTHSAPLDVSGRYVQRGEQLAVVNSGAWEVLAIVDEETFTDWTPRAGDTVRVRLRDHARTFVGRIRGIERTGSRSIQREQLWQVSGGEIVVEPTTREALSPHFEIRVSILNARPEDESFLRDGNSAWVKFGGPRGSFGTLFFRNLLRFVGRMRMS